MDSEMEEENSLGTGVPLETQQMMMQGQMAMDGASTNLGNTSRDPAPDESSTESPGIDIKKAKI
jgi:hypothetical protein